MIAAVLIVVTGVVFNDANGNGVRDAGERGVANVAVSDQRDVVVTDANGSFSLAAADEKGVVFVSVPDGWRAVGSFWRPASSSTLSFALASAPRVTSAWRATWTSAPWTFSPPKSTRLATVSGT